jgi:hypothetical protein
MEIEWQDLSEVRLLRSALRYNLSLQTGTQMLLIAAPIETPRELWCQRSQLQSQRHHSISADTATSLPFGLRNIATLCSVSTSSRWWLLQSRDVSMEEHGRGREVASC